MAYSKSLTEQRSASTLHSTIHPSQYGSEVALADLGESGKDGGVPALPSFEVSWDGDHDPKNPMNWSESRKMLSVCLVSAMGFLVYVSQSLLFGSDAHAANATYRQTLFFFRVRPINPASHGRI